MSKSYREMECVTSSDSVTPLPSWLTPPAEETPGATTPPEPETLPEPEEGTAQSLWDPAVDPDEIGPCEKCGSYEAWWTLTGERKCMRCRPPELARRAYRHAQRIRAKEEKGGEIGNLGYLPSQTPDMQSADGLPQPQGTP